jgi:large subunit ribosomal protein L2
MIQKIIKPITPSQRQTILFINNLTKKEKPIKKITKGFKRSNGRNNQGKITIKHRGGGHKRLYREINFYRSYLSKGDTKAILYDPNRSANIAKIFNPIIKNFFYILAPEGLKVGDKISTGFLSGKINYQYKPELKIGNAFPLSEIPIGSIIHNISLTPKGKAKLIRSAGTSAQLLQKLDNGYSKIRLNSGELRLVLSNCYATLGTVSNINHKKIKLGKAGRSRWLNIRPHVRGVAMNPVDHPHGGGEGKTSGGRPSVTPKGIITKGKPTRSKKKNNQFILEFRKKKNVKK